MEPTESIVFGGPDREFVSLSLAAPDSEGWLSGEIEIRAGGFFGRCRGSFFRRELRRFSESLAEPDLAGSPTLRPLEKHLELHLTGNGRGAIVAEGIARDSFADGNFLTFRLEFDQTSLPSVIRALNILDPG